MKFQNFLCRYYLLNSHLKQRDHSDKSGQTSFCLVEDDISSPNLYYQSRQALSLPLSPRLSLAACLMHCWVQLVEFVTFILSVNVRMFSSKVYL